MDVWTIKLLEVEKSVGAWLRALGLGNLFDPESLDPGKCSYSFSGRCPMRWSLRRLGTEPAMAYRLQLSWSATERYAQRTQSCHWKMQDGASCRLHHAPTPRARQSSLRTVQLVTAVETERSRLALTSRGLLLPRGAPSGKPRPPTIRARAAPYTDSPGRHMNQGESCTCNTRDWTYCHYGIRWHTRAKIETRAEWHAPGHVQRMRAVAELLYSRVEDRISPSRPCFHKIIATHGEYCGELRVPDAATVQKANVLRGQRVL
jgi:hypothetical protein